MILSKEQKKELDIKYRFKCEFYHDGYCLNHPPCQCRKAYKAEIRKGSS